MYHTEVEGKVGIVARVVADSVHSDTGQRITTFELEYPRFIHCFDEETEILSQVGNENPRFRSFESVFELGAKVAQYNPDNEVIDFVYSENNIRNTGSHKMVTLDKKKLSMSVTDKHRVFTKKRTTGNAFLDDTVHADQLLGDYGTRRIPKAGLMNQNQVMTPQEIQLVAWFVADGHRENHKTSNFHFRKLRKIEKVRELMYECGIDYSQHCYGEDTVIRFDSPWWVDKCYMEDGSKIIPDEATQMDQTTYGLFKLALMESDGNVENHEYNTSSQLLAEQIQSIALLHGDAMNIRKYFDGIYKQKFHDSPYVSIRYDKDIFSTDVVDCTVYCVTVPSSYVVVRRKGSAYISGNCEFMTHRMFSRNAMSSRAVPIAKMIEQVRNNPARPIEWGLNQRGMQAGGVHENAEHCENMWMYAAKQAANSAELLMELGLHKQIVNRVLEPFQMMKTVMTATEFNNYFHLRCHSDAQPEIHELAHCMVQARNESVPIKLKAGEWHVPYVITSRNINTGEIMYGQYEVPTAHDNTEWFFEMSLEQAQKVSASCCAQVSFRLNDNSLDKALMIYDKLVNSKPVHASPFEHQATPTDYPYVTDTTELSGIEGATHVDVENNVWSGNFKHWIQFRQLIPENTVY